MSQTSDIISLAKAIDTYGPLAVLLSALIILLIYIVYQLSKMNKKFQEQSLKNDEDYKDSMCDMMTKVLDQFLEDHDVVNTNTTQTKDNKEPDLMKTFVKLRQAMQDNCKDTMNKINADRMGIYLFHNGTLSTHGIKFFKVSCICENIRIGSGIREHSIEHSNISLNLFDMMINELIENGRITIKNDESIKNKNCRIFISSSKIKYVLCTAIFDNSNNILGFVLAEISSDIESDNVEDKYKELDNLVSRLSPILIYSDYVDININKTHDEYIQ